MAQSRPVEPIIDVYNPQNVINVNDDIYYSPGFIGTGEGEIKSLKTIWRGGYLPDDHRVEFRLLEYQLIVKQNNNKIIDYDGTTTSVNEALAYFDLKYNVKPIPGKLEISYRVFYKFASDIFGEQNYNFKITYDLYIIENTEPLPKWNAWTVCERMLNIAETIRQGDKPRFKLDQTQREWLESIETPEFQFTQSTLRECLQGVGAFIHAEPRLLPNEDNDGYQGIVHFDKYGSNEESTFAETYTEYGSKTVSQNIESFATNIDSSVDNFVNSINYASNGALIEPYRGGYKTVLAESSYVRITDESMYIATQYPIRSIKSLKLGWLPYGGGSENGGWKQVDLDLTPYVFENAEYQQLSSYDTQYPTSKAYAVYFTIGEKGIRGLNFKEYALFQEWKTYSIINILTSALGEKVTISDWWTLNFQVEYVPIYPARVQQNKSIINLEDVGKEWTKPYNQGQNLVETQYYGENLKGVIARMGNIDQTITYVIKGFPSVLPRVGDLFNADYYISSCAVELQPYYTKITLALSKDFNKYSEYVGVNSTKRMYEISEQQAFNSEVTYREFCVFADTSQDITYSSNILVDVDYEGVSLKYFLLRALFNKYDTVGKWANRISFVNAQGYDENNNPLYKVALPVICSSFGNACVLSFKYEDNYSAGNYSKWGEGTGQFFVKTMPYTDVYGRIENLYIDFITNAKIEKYKDAPEDYLRYPPFNNDSWLGGTPVLSTGDKPIRVEKGNTEILSFNYQLEFVSVREDIIIGSGLAKKITLVKDYDPNQKARLYLFSNKLNKFKQEYAEEDISRAFNVPTSSNFFVQGGTEVEFRPINPNLPQGASYKSWALVAPFEVKDGNTTKTVYQLLIGCNMTIDSSTTNIFENGKHKGLKMCIVAEKDLYK